MASPDSAAAPNTPVHKFIARVKNHPMVYAFAAVVAAVTVLTQGLDLFSRGADSLSAVRNPYAADFEALGTLDLDARLEFFEDKFGVAKSVYNICDDDATCPTQPPAPLRMYLHETDDVQVRALFEGESLQMYAITVMNADFSPPMSWLGYELGDLGEATYEEALRAADSIQATDRSAITTAKAMVYAEVVAAGAPGDYRGLLLATAPEGYIGPGLILDQESLFALADLQRQAEPLDATTLERFRSGSAPNTFGEFRDDGGTVSSIMREAEDAGSLLFVGTEI